MTTMSAAEFDLNDTGTWFEVDTIDGDHLAIEGHTEEGITGAAITIPLDMAPYLAAQLLEAWTWVDSGGDEVELDEDGWPYED